MSELPALRQRHDDLYRRVLSAVTADTLTAPETRDALLAEMDQLLTDLQAVTEQEMTADTYDWLSTALLNWQVAATSWLEAPRDIAMPKPAGVLPAERRQRIWSDDEVQGWLGDKAWEMSKLRRARDLIERVERIAAQASSEQEQATDWLNARALLAYELIAGDWNLTDQLTARSLLHIRDVWLDQVKEVWAYFNWKDRGSPIGDETGTDYLAACASLDRLLLSPASPKKASPADFCDAEEYLNEELLDHGRVVFAEPPDSPGDTEVGLPATPRGG